MTCFSKIFQTKLIITKDLHPVFNFTEFHILAFFSIFPVEMVSVEQMAASEILQQFRLEFQAAGREIGSTKI